MAAKKPVTPLELLRDRLASRPIGTRAVLVADPHRLIDWPRSLADRKGREWQMPRRRLRHAAGLAPGVERPGAGLPCLEPARR